jgi:bacterioferritin-associated ferredoxin
LVDNVSQYRPLIREAAVFVCVCNALKERDVREAARVAGKSCPKAAFAQLGCKPKCGQCLPFAREVLEDARHSA